MSRLQRLVSKFSQTLQVQSLLIGDRFFVNQDSEKSYYIFVVDRNKESDCRVLASKEREKFTGLNVTAVLTFEEAIEELKSHGADASVFDKRYAGRSIFCFVKADMLKRDRGMM